MFFVIPLFEDPIAGETILILGISLALNEGQEVVEALIGHVVTAQVDELSGNTLGLVGDLENVLVTHLKGVGIGSFRAEQKPRTPVWKSIFQWQNRLL